MAASTGIDAKLRVVDGYFDIQLNSDGDIETEDAFDTAFVVSLFTDKRAAPSQVQQSERRRGWIGNESTPGVEIGSLIWLFTDMARLTRTTINATSDAAAKSLAWMKEDGVLHSSGSVKAVVSQTSPVGVGLVVDVARPGSASVRKFFSLWENTGVNSDVA